MLCKLNDILIYVEIVYQYYNLRRGQWIIPQISKTLNTDSIFTYARRPLVLNLKIWCPSEMQTQYSEQESYTIHQNLHLFWSTAE